MAEKSLNYTPPEVRDIFNHTFFEEFSEPVIISHKSGDILFINRMALSLLGLYSSDIIGTNITGLFPDREKSEISSEISNLINMKTQKEYKKDLEGVILKKDGTYIQTIVNLTLKRHGNTWLIITIIHDNTEKKKRGRILPW